MDAIKVALMQTVLQSLESARKETADYKPKIQVHQSMATAMIVGEGKVNLDYEHLRNRYLSMPYLKEEPEFKSVLERIIIKTDAAIAEMDEGELMSIKEKTEKLVGDVRNYLHDKAHVCTTV